MMNPQQPAQICLDMKKHRIRIHKQTLHLIGDPSHIQLLVNPERQALAIRACDPKDPLSHRVDKNALVGNCLELYSRELLKELSLVELSLAESQSYSLYGSVDYAHHIAEFHMPSIEPLGEEVRVRDS